MLQIINVKDEEIFSYSLCLLRVCGTPLNEHKALVKNLNDISGSSKYYDVINQSFNALVFLNIGKNVLEIQCGNEVINKVIYYKPPDHCLSVRLIYVTCLDEEKFQGPDDMQRNANDAIKRIQIGASLLQTYLGETLYAEGLGRKTFQLEMTKQNKPKVFVIQLPLTIQEAQKFSQEKLWETIAIQILSSPLASRSCKYLAFFCGTRFQNPQRKSLRNERDILALTRGHVSLGGGGLALVGTGALYTWASDTSEVLESLTSTQKVDSRYFMDFSANRGTYGSCYGTHLGSVLHELGHTFDLGHTSHGLMGRGFEDFHLFFTATHLVNEYGKNSQHKNLVKHNYLSSSLVKHPSIFTPNFVRKQRAQNINMVVEPLKDTLSSTVYSAPHVSQTKTSSGHSHGSVTETGSPLNPGFERFELSCLSQSLKDEFAPKSSEGGESESGLVAPQVLFNSTCLKLENSNFNSVNNNETSNLNHPKETRCRAFWARSNAVLLAHHKWVTGTVDTGIPQLNGSVLRSSCGIRAIELRDSRMMAFHHWEYLEKTPPSVLHLPWAQVPHWPPGDTIEVVAVDDNGGLLKGCLIPRPL